MEFTGNNWPYEAIQSAQRSNTSNEQVTVLLMGEQDDVTALQALCTQLSYLQKYGRPFAKFYNEYFVLRPVKGKTQQRVSRFHYAQFTISGLRRAQLEKLLEHCPTLLYEIAACDEGKLKVTRNYEEYDQDKFLSTVEAALQERGWKRGTDPTPFLSIEDWQESKKNTPPLGYHEENRWWTRLCKVWKR
jgi:hypothetical protein